MALLAVVAAAVAVRIPFAAVPLSHDEAGFLTVAAQWTPGTSLYGNYWVDRPPLLIAAYGIPVHVASLVPAVDAGTALRLLGMVIAAVSVLLAAVLGHRAAPGTWAPVLTASTCAALISSPLLGMTQVNGELIALPAALGALVGVDSSSRGPDRWTIPVAAAAGVLGASAALVKQNVADGLIVLVVVAAVLAVRSQPRRGARVLVAGIVGALATVAATALVAAGRGTDSLALWDAVVTFRGQATAVITSSASAATADRAATLALAAVLTGTPLLLTLLFRRRGADGADRERSAPIFATPVVLVLVGWNVFGVAAGGSYWLHNLVCLVPGLTLTMAAHCHHNPTSPRRAALVLVPMAASLLVSVSVAVANPPTVPVEEAAVAGYLRRHAVPGDTGLVAFGDASLLRAARLSSPYPQLWSLPVRVLDPDLTSFSALLRDPLRAPTWIVRDGPSLAGWGLDATQADRVVRRTYDLVAVRGKYQILRRDTDLPGSGG